MQKKYQVASDAFEGDALLHLNGIVVTMETEKDSDEPIVGRSGKTKAYKTTQGGRLYLHDHQVQPVS